MCGNYLPLIARKRTRLLTNATTDIIVIDMIIYIVNNNNGEKITSKKIYISGYSMSGRGLLDIDNRSVYHELEKIVKSKGDNLVQRIAELR